MIQARLLNIFYEERGTGPVSLAIHAERMSRKSYDGGAKVYCRLDLLNSKVVNLKCLTELWRLGQGASWNLSPKFFSNLRCTGCIKKCLIAILA